MSGAGNTRDPLRLAAPAAGRRRRLALAIALSAGATVAAAGLLGTSGYLISRAALRPPVLSLMVAIVAVRAFGLARAGLRYGERLCSHDLALRQLTRVRGGFYRRLSGLLPGRLAGYRGGDLLARFVGDVDALADLYLRSAIPAAAALVTLGATVAAAWLMLPAAGFVTLVSLTVAALVLPWLGSRLAERSAARQGAVRALMTAQLVESLDGAEELVVLGRGGDRVRALRETDARLSSLARRDACATALLDGVGATLNGAGLIAVLLVCVPAVRAGRLDGVLVAALAFLLLAAGEAVATLPDAARSLRTSLAAARRLHAVQRQRPAVCDPPEALRPAVPWPLRATGVCLRYGPDEPWTLDGADLELMPGERVALLGASGAGKSTLAELLVRLRDPQQGTVTLGGVDVRAMNQRELRRHVLLCSQDAHVFNTTIRENLLVARRDASERELHEALEAVGLDGWARGLPDGLDTLAGADGQLLSGGQRQRLALARALLSDAMFLILDEPTAHLDGPLAARVIAGVLAHTRGRGLLAITHDPALLGGFDRVLRLCDGVVEAALGHLTRGESDRDSAASALGAAPAARPQGFMLDPSTPRVQSPLRLHQFSR